jgi:hypothetical protein
MSSCRSTRTNFNVDLTQFSFSTFFGREGLDLLGALARMLKKQQLQPLSINRLAAIARTGA